VKELRDALREAPLTDAGARARALRVVQAATADVEPVRGRPRFAPVLAVTAVVAAVVVAAIGASGPAVARWVRDVLGTTREPPALVRVPGGGKLLVTAPGGAWVVSADGSRRRLGRYAGASWSPHGRFAVVWRGGELLAVEPGGAVRWAIERRSRVRAARWAPVDGYRIAYLAGASLRVVNGDGTGDRRLAAARATPPAWRPDGEHVLAYADRRGRVRVVAVDLGLELWRSRPLGAVRELEWSPGGHRLAVATDRTVTLLDRDGAMAASAAHRRGAPAGGDRDASGGAAHRRGAPGGDRATPGGAARGGAPAAAERLLRPSDGARPPAQFVVDDVAWSPRGQLTVVRRGATRSEVVVGGRTRFGGRGRLGDVAWSPDGRRLLVPWPSADRWILIGARRTAIGHVTRQFRGFPGAVEWCCR
jgi:hypothetical protein